MHSPLSSGFRHFSLQFFQFSKKMVLFPCMFLPPGFPLRGSCRRKPTDEVASHPRHNFTAVIINELAPRSRNPPTEAPKFSVLPPLMMQQVFSAALRIGCRNDSRPTSSVTAAAVPPSPRGEGFFAKELLPATAPGFPLRGSCLRSRLMRWHLTLAATSRQCQTQRPTENRFPAVRQKN